MTAPNSSLGLYIHIPFCEKKCPYCAFYSVPGKGQSMGRLVDALLKEIDLYRLTEPLETIYIGGGSPTCLPADMLMAFVRELSKRFGRVDEFTLECNPAQAKETVLMQLHEYGVNRLSIGAQSFCDKDLKTLGRIHSSSDIEKAVKAGRNAGFENIGLDLIFAVPGSDLLSWQTSLEKTIALNVQHVSAYSLTIEKDTPFEKLWQSGVLGAINEPLERTMYELACVQLRNAEFNHYEISNFAKIGFQCRHNRRYWKNLSVIGIGPSAASWYYNRRTSNIADLDEYIEAIEAGQFCYCNQQSPNAEQIAAETAVLNLRMCEGIDLAGYQQQTGFDLHTLFPWAIEKNCKLGLLVQTNERLCLTEVGLSFADTVAADFATPD